MTKTTIWLLPLVALALALGTVVSCGNRHAGAAGGGEASDDDASPADDDTAQTVWIDPTSGLTWQNGATVGAESYVWQDAQNYCAGLNWDGAGNWRLPTISELRSLIQGCPTTVTGGSCGVTDQCLRADCWNPTCSCPYGGGPGPACSYWPAELSGSVGAYAYWSSSPVANRPRFAWLVQFYSGYIGVNEVGYPALARCVR